MFQIETSVVYGCFYTILTDDIASDISKFVTSNMSISVDGDGLLFAENDTTTNGYFEVHLTDVTAFKGKTINWKIDYELPTSSGFQMRVLERSESNTSWHRLNADAINPSNTHQEQSTLISDDATRLAFRFYSSNTERIDSIKTWNWIVYPV